MASVGLGQANSGDHFVEGGDMTQAVEYGENFRLAKSFRHSVSPTQVTHFQDCQQKNPHRETVAERTAERTAEVNI